MQNEKSKFKEAFYQRLINLSIHTLKFAQTLRRDPLLRSIIDQLIRAITSIGANVFEARASSSRRDYIHFFEIALKSANESQFWLTIISNYSPSYQTQTDPLIDEVNQISKILASSILTLKGKK